MAGPASRQVARALGFRELGSQLSVRLDLDALTDAHPPGDPTTEYRGRDS